MTYAKESQAVRRVQRKYLWRLVVMSGLLLAVHGMSMLFLARVPIVAASVLYDYVCGIWLRIFMDWGIGVCGVRRTGPFYDCGIMA
jgi:hypothetical protein